MNRFTPKRAIRSFVVRAGRMTPGQHSALASLWPRYGIDAATKPDLDSLFGRHAEKVVEIGFGNGDALLTLASRYPEQDFVGIEVHPPGVGRLLAGIERLQLSNVRVMREDALNIFERDLAPESLARINIWFPDPWPKKKHHKRRLIQSANLSCFVSRLQSGGVLHMATDWQEYAEQMLEVAGTLPELHNLDSAGAYYQGETDRPVTRFETRGRILGHGVWDLRFTRS